MRALECMLCKHSCVHAYECVLQRVRLVYARATMNFNMRLLSNWCWHLHSRAHTRTHTHSRALTRTHARTHTRARAGKPLFNCNKLELDLMYLKNCGECEVVKKGEKILGQTTTFMRTRAMLDNNVYIAHWAHRTPHTAHSSQHTKHQTICMVQIKPDPTAKSGYHPTSGPWDVDLYLQVRSCVPALGGWVLGMCVQSLFSYWWHASMYVSPPLVFLLVAGSSDAAKHEV